MLDDALDAFVLLDDNGTPEDMRKRGAHGRLPPELRDNPNTRQVLYSSNWDDALYGFLLGEWRDSLGCPLNFGWRLAFELVRTKTRLLVDM